MTKRTFSEKKKKKKKILFFGFWAKKGQNGLKMGFFKYYQKSMHRTFLFCMKLQQHEDLKLNKVISWEKLCYGVFGPNRCPKWGFSIFFLKNQCMEVFWFFEWSYSKVKASKWLNSFYGKNSGVFGQKVAQNKIFFSFLLTNPCIFCFFSVNL